MLTRQLAVGLLDLRGGRLLVDAQHGVWIPARSHAAANLTGDEDASRADHAAREP